jgi:putative aldouronate transport system permease protein
MLKQWDLQILVIPAIIYIFVFMYLPMYGVLMAFQKYQLGDFPGFSPWVGFDNFAYLFTDPFFPNVMRNTIAMSLLRLVIGFPMPIIFALMLNEVRILGFKKTTQTISYLPHFISWVVASALLFDFLNVDNGAVNNILMALGLIKDPIYFFGKKEIFWGLATVTDLWKELGWSAIIYVAAITSVDSELYEAAAIDGASRLQRIWHITLASIRPTVIILFIFAIGGLLNSNFDQVWMLTRQMSNALLRETADVFDTYVLRIGIGQMRFSYSAAVGLFRTFFNFLLVLGANWLANKVGDYGLF